MTNEQEIKKKLQRLEKFNDPIMLMMIFLALPAAKAALLPAFYFLPGWPLKLIQL
jgi:hypothetical protein